jgi:sterol desaturase/sphingolipid hydroxylase (fatty acid hydroxylase superfamily)
MHSPTLLSLLLGLLILAAFFRLIERRNTSIFRRDRIVDFIYWFFTPLVTRTVSLGVLALVFFFTTGRVPPKFGSVWFGAQPLALQVIEVFVVSDLIGYASHRLFHRQPLWRFHAVHHSSEMLDWLSSTRLHPVNEVLTRLIQVLPLYVAGFDPRVVAAAVPLLTFWAIFLHANVPWTFGPLRYVIASPAFHRWHHTTEDEGLDRNFAGLFPWIDILFGTFYMPDRQPERFGVRERIPPGFWGQLTWPWIQ